jgi:hypothetical protein
MGHPCTGNFRVVEIRYQQLNKPGPHTSIFFPSREALLLRNPVCKVEYGIHFRISVWVKIPRRKKLGGEQKKFSEANFSQDSTV